MYKCCTCVRTCTKLIYNILLSRLSALPSYMYFTYMIVHLYIHACVCNLKCVHNVYAVPFCVYIHNTFMIPRLFTTFISIMMS